MEHEKHPAPNLRQALTRAHRLVVLNAVLIACTTLLFAGVVVMRDNLTRNLGVFADMVGTSVEPALIAGDRGVLRDRLASIAGDGLVERFEIVDRQGNMLITWDRPGTGITHVMDRWVSERLWPEPIARPVGRGSRAVAEIRAFGSAAGVVRFLQAGFVAGVVCLGLALFATSVMARRMWARVTQPLRHVAEVARSVRVERAFHRRVPPPGLAEVDNLVHDFNALLSELQGWYTGMEQENQELAWAATHDGLTGLGNRIAFERQINATIQNVGTEGHRFAVLYLDADRFKQINDSLGHGAGDTVLQELAQRLERCIRNADKAFRVGGDEFAIILAPPIGVEDVERVTERICESMAPDIRLEDGRLVRMSVSVGYAVYPDDAMTPVELVRVADNDMYRNKFGACDHQVVNLH